MRAHENAIFFYVVSNLELVVLRTGFSCMDILLNQTAWNGWKQLPSAKGGLRWAQSEQCKG